MTQPAPTKEVSANPASLRPFAMFAAVLSLAFAKVLCDLAVFAANSSRFDYILVIPVLSCALVWLQGHWDRPDFQHTSAWATHAMLALSGAPMRADGFVFTFPEFSVVVARECSGIRSSLVLFIVGLIAGHLFLKTPWKKAALTLLVIPLSIIRNGFRITSVSLLSVYDDTMSR